MAAPMIKLQINQDGASYLPVLDGGPLHHLHKLVPVEKWWNECVFHPLSNINLTRKNVIFFSRSQDGGAHVDEKISNHDYSAFSRNGDPNFRAATGGVSQPSLGGMGAIIRQIAWEVDQVLLALGY